MKNCWPQRSDSHLAMLRAVMCVPPPGADGEARGETAGKIHGWNHGARLLFPVFLVANEPAIAVPFANLRAKVRGIEALAQGRRVMALIPEAARFARALGLAPLPDDASINQACRGLHRSA